MFLHTFGTFFYGTVELGSHRQSFLLVAKTINGQDFCIVVDNLVVEFGDGLLKTLVAVPPHIVVGGGVVVFLV